MITLGGDAELELVDSLDPFSEGVVFSVRPPKKSWKNIANLSGGEKVMPKPLFYICVILSGNEFQVLPQRIPEVSVYFLVMVTMILFTIFRL
jgi:structural maintenance of chromosome 4